MTRARLCLALMTMAVLALGAPALAHWDPGDGHKMHFPQLPDPNGWDVDFDDYAAALMTIYATADWVSDDWQCTQTGPVTDIHFWVSMQGDASLPDAPELPFEIWWVTAYIYGNMLGDEGFNIPDKNDLRWSGHFHDEGLEHVTWRYAGSGDQGWFGDADEGLIEHDHENYYQVNITGIQEMPGEVDPPFVQQDGEIYWLTLKVDACEPGDLSSTEQLGWKTALPAGSPAANYLSPAVYHYWEWDGEHLEDNDIDEWRQIVLGELPRDLAFVITPEPATLALMGLGAVGLAAVRRRRAS